MKFSKGEIEKEKNIIIMTPVGKEKSYKLDVNTGALYGLRGTAIATMPSILNEGMKIAFSNIHHPEDKITMLLGNFYTVLYHSNSKFNDLVQKGILLTLDKIINAVGTFHIGYTSIKQLQYIDEHFATYVKYMKDETIYPEMNKTNKTESFKEWHNQSLLNEKFNLNECSDYTKRVIERLLKNPRIVFSDKEIRILIGICEHQLTTFFNNDPHLISNWLTYYKQMCDDLQVPIKKGNFMMEYNAVRREFVIKKARVDRAKLQAKYAKHSKAWEFENNEYTIVVPTCEDDFITEGRLQHNCVGGYVNSVMNEKSDCYVIFLRKKDNPKVPVLTVEVDSYNQEPYIRQFLLAYNQSPNRSTQPELYDLKDDLQQWLRENW